MSPKVMNPVETANFVALQINLFFKKKPLTQARILHKRHKHDSGNRGEKLLIAT